MTSLICQDHLCQYLLNAYKTYFPQHWTDQTKRPSEYIYSYTEPLGFILFTRKSDLLESSTALQLACKHSTDQLKSQWWLSLWDVWVDNHEFCSPQTQRYSFKYTHTAHKWHLIHQQGHFCQQCNCIMRYANKFSCIQIQEKYQQIA